MGILGLTHDETGTPLQRLPVSIKVSIGLAPDEKAGRKHPSKLDHFTFLRKEMDRGGEASWAPDPEITQAYGDRPREVGVVFISNRIDDVFRTSYAWWTQTECRCRGELVHVEGGEWRMQATRRTQKNPEGEPWPGKYRYSDGPRKGQPVEGCGDGCPDLEMGNCKPSGDLYFLLDRFPAMGFICRIHTTSYRSIRQIYSALHQLEQTFGGLSGHRMMLKVRPEKGTYTDANGKKHTTTLQILSLELSAQDWQELIDHSTEVQRLFSEQRRALGPGRIEVYEDEHEISREIASEFHPVDDEPEPQQQPMEIAADIIELAQRAGLNRAQLWDLAGRFPDQAELRSELGSRAGARANGLGANQGNRETVGTLQTTAPAPGQPTAQQPEAAPARKSHKREPAATGFGW